jgi:hypothetical protein
VCRNDSITVHICSVGPPGQVGPAAGVGGSTYSLSRGCAPRQGQDQPAGDCLQLAWWKSLVFKGPIPVSPFISLRLGEEQVFWTQGLAATCHPTCASTVRVLLSLLPTSHYSQPPPMFPTWSCSLKTIPPHFCLCPPLRPECLALLSIKAWLTIPACRTADFLSYPLNVPVMYPTLVAYPCGVFISSPLQLGCCTVQLSTGPGNQQMLLWWMNPWVEVWMSLRCTFKPGW